jgi:hypothetical protein
MICHIIIASSGISGIDNNVRKSFKHLIANVGTYSVSPIVGRNGEDFVHDYLGRYASVAVLTRELHADTD